MSNEEIYDKEIAPALLELCKKAQDLGFSFVASVEWERGENGRTEYQPPANKVGIAQLLVHWAARCNGNVDNLIWTIKKHGKEHGHSSIELRLMEMRDAA